MATCQNGYAAIPSGTDPRLVAIPRIAGRVLRNGPDVIFTHLVNFWDQNIEDIDAAKDEWGYSYRPIRGQSRGYSNHAGGTAIDVNAMQHPRGVRNTFSAAQKKKMNAYLKNELEGVVRWGEMYNPRLSKVDGMHMEIIGSPAQVARVAAKLAKGGATGAPVIKPSGPKPTSSSKRYPQIALIIDGAFGSYTVSALQHLLKYITKDYKGKITGKLDKATIKAMQKWLNRIGYGAGKVDGIAGRQTFKALQKLLAKRAGYTRAIDGNMAKYAVSALQRYLNGQRRYF